jgi:hypothetical protein
MIKSRVRSAFFVLKNSEPSLKSLMKGIINFFFFLREKEKEKFVVKFVSFHCVCMSCKLKHENFRFKIFKKSIQMTPILYISARKLTTITNQKFCKRTKKNHLRSC